MNQDPILASFTIIRDEIERILEAFDTFDSEVSDTAEKLIAMEADFTPYHIEYMGLVRDKLRIHVEAQHKLIDKLDKILEKWGSDD